MKKQYEEPATEELLVQQETAFLTSSDVIPGRADNGYEDNEMEGL